MPNNSDKIAQEMKTIFNGIKSLDGQELGGGKISNKIRLAVDDKEAAINAVADAYEIKEPLADDLINLLNEQGVTPEDVIREILKRQIGKAMGFE